MTDITDHNDPNPFIRKWEQAVHRQEAKGMLALRREIKRDTDDLQALVARGIRRICIIGKKLEAVKRIAGHGNAIDAWRKLGYSQPQANKYIQASQYEPLLRELQGQRAEPLGIGQAYEVAVSARKLLTENPVQFKDLEDPKAIAGLATAVAVPRVSKPRPRSIEKTRDRVAQVIGELELHMHESEARALIAQLHDWSGKVLEDDKEASA